eukprot:3160964-Prymnesium_polylepis.1
MQAVADEDDEAEGSFDDELDEDMGDACSDDDRALAADSAAVQHSQPPTPQPLQSDASGEGWQGDSEEAL